MWGGSRSVPDAAADLTEPMPDDQNVSRQPRSRAHLRLVVAEQEIELVVPFTAAEFQQLVRIAFAESRSTVAEVIRQFALEGIADWPARVEALDGS
jgi:hypothetical protein